MDYPKFTVSNKKEESISIQRVDMDRSADLSEEVYKEF